MTVDKELFGDSLPTYLTRFVGRDREIATGAVAAASGAARHGLWSRRCR
jgi:hypothetical protein